MNFAGAGYKWFVMALLFGAAGLNYADRTAITAVFPLLHRDLGMSDVALGATGTVFLWTYAFASPFAGFFGDRLSRARLLTMSLGAWSLVMTLSAFANSATHLLLMRALLGLAEAAYIPAATALIADHHGPDTRAKAIALHLAGFSTGMVGGGALAGYLGDRFGWRPSFVILGLFGLALTGVCALFLRDSAARREAIRQPAPPMLMLHSIRRLLAIPSFLILMFEIILSGSVLWIFVNWLPLFFKETFALSLAMAGLYGTLWMQGGRVVGLLAGGFSSDRVARLHPRFRMLIMSGAYLLAAPLLIVFAFSNQFLWIASAICGFAFLVGVGYVNAQPLLCELVPEDVRSTAVGLMNMGACFVGGLGVLLAGALKSTLGLNYAFASLSIIQAGVALMLLIAFLTILRRDLDRANAGTIPAEPKAAATR